jgi:hypothetical protein
MAGPTENCEIPRYFEFEYGLWPFLDASTEKTRTSDGGEVLSRRSDTSPRVGSLSMKQSRYRSPPRRMASTEKRISPIFIHSRSVPGRQTPTGISLRRSLGRGRQTASAAAGSESAATSTRSGRWSIPGLTFDMRGAWRPQAGKRPLDGRVGRLCLHASPIGDCPSNRAFSVDARPQECGSRLGAADK